MSTEELNFERCLIIYPTTVVKRELREDELTRISTVDVFYPFWRKERLRNEAATLNFLRLNTSIPVPRCQLYTREGLLHLETERITNGILLGEVGKDSQAAAVKAVEDQMNSNILPQLRSLRRNYIGSVDENLPVFPPQRVYGRDRRAWPRISSETEDFVLCHNDLAPQNIFIDPSSFQIVGIIDWEFAGYFPQDFELPLWREFEWKNRQKIYNDAESRELEFFGFQLGDLQDHSKVRMTTNGRVGV